VGKIFQGKRRAKAGIETWHGAPSRVGSTHRKKVGKMIPGGSLVKVLLGHGVGGIHLPDWGWGEKNLIKILGGEEDGYGRKERG